MTSSADGAGGDTPVSGVGPTPAQTASPQTPVLALSCRMLRSPSHESVTTDLSLFSVSSLASDLRNMRLISLKPGDRLARGPSPNPDSKGQISISRPPDIPEILWFEEENELIKSCAALSSALGLQRSFSTSDITQLPPAEPPQSDTPPGPNSIRPAVSEPALNSLQRCSFLLEQHNLNRASRSCSTWVAVGDISSASQLPSPHGGQNPSTAPTLPPGPQPPSFTPADLVRSVNKKVRQNYIRRRLLMTYKALERLSQSEFNLDRLEAAASASSAHTSSPTPSTPQQTPSLLTVPGAPPPVQPPLSPTSTVLRVVKPRTGDRNYPLTVRDVERQRGKPLSKYDRNMMIFNWLHTLELSDYEKLEKT